MSLELRKGKKGFAEQKTVTRYCPSSLQGFSLHSAQGKAGRGSAATASSGTEAAGAPASHFRRLAVMENAEH